MDPNVNLSQLRELAGEITEAAAGRVLMLDDAGDRVDWAAVELAELVQALDEWMSAGGFLPAAWTLDAIDQAGRTAGPMEGV